ncbi:MAG TPA: hypothetical protein VIR31_04490 [Nitrososphaeraceae archaeon]
MTGSDIENFGLLAIGTFIGGLFDASFSEVRASIILGTLLILVFAIISLTCLKQKRKRGRQIT